MMRIQRVSSTGGHVKFSPATLECLGKVEGDQPVFVLGGVSQDGSYGWLARGGFLEVFWCRTGQRVAAWCFGALLKEPNTFITSVTECCFDKGSKLIVATSTVNSEGLVCVFDPKNCTINKAIEVPFEVTSLEVVSTVGHGHSHNVVLSEHLQHFCGVLAVGTQCGHVYLVDLCLDDDVDGCDELSPNTLQHIDANMRDIVSRRYNAITRGKHLCLELGDEFHTRGYYNYSKPDGTCIKSYTAEEISTSSLKFVKQTGLLVVGFSFGMFQLWRLQGPTLEYSSRFEDNQAPVVSFAYQEPENDPRKFCYLWVGRGPTPSDSVEQFTSSITLFQLGYGTKNWYDGFGYLFEELTSVGPRFEHALTSDPYNLTPGHDEGSRIISCYTIQDPNYQMPARKSDESFEGSGGPDISLCVFVWEAAATDPHAKPPVYLGIFDMNRWYHAQMPVSLRLYGGSCDTSPYFAMCSLDGVQQEVTTDNIMAVYIGQNKVAKFHSVTVPQPEQHFFPSSLCFAATCVTECGVVHAKYLGIQRQILRDLAVQGASALADPTNLYNLCLQAGLLPRTIDMTSSTLPASYKREMLLTMALDYNMIGFINNCVAQWASSELASIGCTLRFLLEWAWKRAAALKETVDKLCVCLYDWSGLHLDQQTLQLLHQHHTGLQSLSLIIANMAAQNTATTDQGRAELDTKQKVIKLIGEHIGLVLWFYGVDLLPEYSDESEMSEGFVYPGRSLTEFYKKRRAEIQKLHSDVKPSDVLMIDSLTGQMGEPLRNLWEIEGGNGLYPPSSIHALLNMYLLENVGQREKQIIVFYLLCDLLNSAPEDLQPKFNEKVQKFTQAYNLPLGLSKLVQGMWLLDHKDFEDSLFYLLDPNVQREIPPWQHLHILKALLYQGKHKLALQYMKIRDPPLVTPEDIKIKLTVLLANGLTAEAFEYQRLYRDKNNSQDLLSHLFLGCQQTKTVDQLLLLPFSEDEERHLVSHLKGCQDMHSQELLVLYYLLRARYVEAVQLNQKIKHQFVSDLDPGVRERSRVRNSLVDGYLKVLPSIQRKLCFGPDRPTQQRIGARREFQRPSPLSTIVHRNRHKQTLTRATLLQTVLNKVQEVNALTRETLGEDLTQVRAGESLNEGDVAGPFVGTPAMTPRSSRTSSSHVPEVVFPQKREVPSFASSFVGMSPPGLKSPFKSRTLATPSSPLQSELSRLNNTLRRRQHMFTAEALSLLKTPPVKRKTPSKILQQSVSVAATPHSILKMRHKPHISTEKPEKPEPIEKLKFNNDDLHLPTPPRLTRRSAFNVQKEPKTPEVEHIDTEISATETLAKVRDSPETEILTSLESNAVDHSQKHLRFIGVSPEVSAEINPPVVLHAEQGNGDQLYPSPTGRKSIKDKSPSLERQSPVLGSQHIGPSHAEDGPVATMDIPDQPSEVNTADDPCVIEDDSESEDIEMEDEPVTVDEDVTFNFGDKLKKRVLDMDETPDTVPLSNVIDDNSSVSRLSPEPMQEEQSVSSADENSSDIKENIKPNSIIINQNVQVSSEVDAQATDDLSDVVDNNSEPDGNGQSEICTENIKADRMNEDNIGESVTMNEPAENVNSETVTNAQDDDSCEINLRLSEDDQNSKDSEIFSKANEEILSKKEQHDSEFNEKVTKIKTPTKITKITEHITYTKTTSEVVKVVDSDENHRSSQHLNEDQVSTSVEDSNVEGKFDDREKPDLASGDHKPQKKTEVETKTEADSTSSEAPKVANADSTSADLKENETEEKGKPRKSVTRTPSRRGRKRQDSLSTTPSRRSSRLISKTEETDQPSTSNQQSPVNSNQKPDRESGRPVCLSHGHVGDHSYASPPPRRSQRFHSPHSICRICPDHQPAQLFKTPPRPSRGEVLPLTPPKSNASSPASSTSIEHEATTPNREPRPSAARSTRSNTRSRSRSKSPTSTTEPESMTRIKTKPQRGRKSSSRSSSRASSPGQPISSQEMPLSEESFMMRLRSGQQVPSRETTPDSTRTASTIPSSIDDEFDKPNFTFSNPLALDGAYGENSAPGTPVHAFIFSPPLTRSRRRISCGGKATPDAVVTNSILGPSTLSQSPAKNTRSTKKSQNKEDAAYCAPTDSPINFLSPVKEEEIPGVRATRQRRVKATTGAPKPAKKRKPLKW